MKRRERHEMFYCPACQSTYAREDCLDAVEYEDGAIEGRCPHCSTEKYRIQEPCDRWWECPECGERWVCANLDKARADIMRHCKGSCEACAYARACGWMRIPYVKMAEELRAIVGGFHFPWEES